MWGVVVATAEQISAPRTPALLCEHQNANPPANPIQIQIASVDVHAHTAGLMACGTLEHPVHHVILVSLNCCEYRGDNMATSAHVLESTHVRQVEGRRADRAERTIA